MKQLFIIAFGIIFLAACTSTSKNDYTILGKIEGKVPAKIYLKYYSDGNMNTIDSSEFVNGEFKFKGSLTSPDYYYLQIGPANNRMGFFIENSQISITAHIDSLRNMVVTGSKTQDDYIAYSDSKAIFDDQLKELYAKYKATKDEDAQMEIEVKYDSIDNLKLEFTKDYVMNNGNTMLAPFIIRRELIHSIELDELEKLTNTISPELKENTYTQELYKRIETLRSLQPGLQAPEFTQIDTAGNPVNLSDFKGKYVLIDFWASWCSPCRKANPTVVAMYNKYAAKNFTVLGVSMDSDRSKWLEAIEADGLTWSHVSTLDSWKNPVGKIYAVNSIPHAILIGPDGNIIKRGVHADELDELLGGLIN